MEIDCSVPCPFYLKTLNSCPSKHISIHEIHTSDTLYELAMVGLSVSPYFTSFLLLMSVCLFRTTRGVLIMMMVFSQNMIIEFLKGNLRDPRPNYECNKQFGNPSNHACFYSSLIVWMLLEFIFLDKKYRFSNTMVKSLLFIASPFILYSRIYLNYHSIEQIWNGVFLGLLIGVSWFIISIHYILRSDNIIRRIFKKLNLLNNLSEFNMQNDFCDMDEEERLYQKYLELTEKGKNISNLKNQLKNFKENLENLEFMRKNENENEKQKEVSRKKQKEETKKNS